MIENLLSLIDLEPPMGDLSIGNRLDTARSVWVRAGVGEGGLSKTRIIHQRILRLHGPAKLHKVGLRPARGYHKCASEVDHDWVTSFRVRVRRLGRWTEVLCEDNLRKPRTDRLRWFDLAGVEGDAVIIEVRRCGVDGGWTSWNTAMAAFELWGELLAPIGPRFERRLQVAAIELNNFPAGVTATRVNGSVRFSTADFSVGFRLDRPAWSWLSLGIEDNQLLNTNLLLTNPVKCDQGLQLHAIGAAPRVAPAVRCDLRGTVSVRGGDVIYDVKTGGQYYKYHWRVRSSGLTLKVVREGRRAESVWTSAAWLIGWSNDVAPTHAVGGLVRQGETGTIALPMWINAPGFGTWMVESDDAAASLRSECRRPAGVNIVELKVGEKTLKDGTYRLLAGRHEATFRMRPIRPPLRLKQGVPPVVKRALERTYYVAPTYRADLGTLSNSGASMGCPICADSWMAVLPHLDLSGGVVGGPDGVELIRVSLERLLDGGPGYAAGVVSHGGKTHDADDEYLMTGAVTLRAIGEFLGKYADVKWYRAHRTQIAKKIQLMQARDLDCDGLIESKYRTGVSGSGQWSTCWLDVLSFGWKCAWSNAILYGALREMGAGLRRFGDEAGAKELDVWRTQLKASYRDTFWNEATGWLAGWRCKADKLHDYAFLPINGTAVREGLLAPEEGRAVMTRLLTEAKRVGLSDAALGLPMNLWNIPDGDRADILQGYPFGYYQNGGRTHSQARHTVMALYTMGMTTEADALLERLCVGFAEASTFGGNQTGVDWRAWDDSLCGYEGLLTDQFGLWEAILWRWGK
jgi:hypothetical protein